MSEREPSSLPGVRYGTIERRVDPRGAFRELWRDSSFATVPPSDAGQAPDTVARFVQANLSSSAAGVLRGLHVHRRQLDHWTVVSGRAFVALVDVRGPLAELGPPVVETRELAADEWVTIPAGVAHGFLALEPLELIYLVTNEYDGSDELGFAWDDADAAVAWPPVGEASGEASGVGRIGPILSERDRSNPTLRELIARLRDPA